MPRRHTSCPACRIRVHADSPAITVLENRCPICGAALVPVASASEVMGFRCFELESLYLEPSDGQPDRPVTPGETSRGEAASARDSEDARRWSDDGGDEAGVVAARLPAPR